jgi:hypothetical protein
MKRKKKRKTTLQPIIFFCGEFSQLGNQKKGLANLTKEILGFKKKIAIF